MMAKIHDIRNRTQRTNGTRSLSQIRYIARHHSATTSGDFDSFWKTWNGVKGWKTGGYHEIILRDGSVQLCYDPEEITNGVANHNTPTYHICVVGNGSFTNEQEKTFKERCLYNMERLNVPVERVLGHREFSGASTACPGIDMNMVRRNLKLGAVTATVPPVNDRNYILLGDTGAEVKKLQEDLNKAGFKLTVDGIFGESTKEAVLKFQLRTNLERDGIVGASTKAKLAAVIEREPKQTVEENKKDAQPTKSLATEWEIAKKHKVTDGSNPQKSVTKEEVAAMIVRANDLK